MDWTDLVNVGTSGVDQNTLTKTGGGAWGGGAASVQVISGDGAMEFAALETNKARMAGLSGFNADAHFSTIGYALHLTGGGTVNVWEGGSLVTGVGNYQSGDVFRVERVGAAIRYLKNGGVLYASLVPSSGDLIADVSLNQTGATIADGQIEAVPVVPDDLTLRVDDLEAAVAALQQALAAIPPVAISGETGIVEPVIGSNGTINVNVGTGPGQIPQLDVNGQLDPNTLLSASTRVAYLEYSVPQGQDIGGCGAHDLRNYNILYGDTSFISLESTGSFAGKHITLEPGTYRIDGYALGSDAGTYKLYLYDATSGSPVGSNILASNVVLNGTSAASRSRWDDSDPMVTYSFLKGDISLNSQTILEVREVCLGPAASGGYQTQDSLSQLIGIPELYSQIIFTKIQ